MKNKILLVIGVIIITLGVGATIALAIGKNNKENVTESIQGETTNTNMVEDTASREEYTPAVEYKYSFEVPEEIASSDAWQEYMKSNFVTEFNFQEAGGRIFSMSPLDTYMVYVEYINGECCVWVEDEAQNTIAIFE